MTSVIFLDLGKFMLYLEGQMSHILIIYVIYVFREVVKQNLIQSHVKEVLANIMSIFQQKQREIEIRLAKIK